MRLKYWASAGWLLTADGSHDHPVEPEGLAKCVVPSPSLCEPINVQPVQPWLSAFESGDKDDPDKNEDSIEENTKFVAPEEDEIIFDLIDQ